MPRGLANLQGALEWLRKGGAAARQTTSGTINILDLGSATGKNSAKELKEAVEAIRSSKVKHSIIMVQQHIIVLHSAGSRSCIGYASCVGSRQIPEKRLLHSHCMDTACSSCQVCKSIDHMTRASVADCMAGLSAGLMMQCIQVQRCVTSPAVGSQLKDMQAAVTDLVLSRGCTGPAFMATKVV